MLDWNLAEKHGTWPPFEICLKDYTLISSLRLSGGWGGLAWVFRSCSECHFVSRLFSFFKLWLKSDAQMPFTAFSSAIHLAAWHNFNLTYRLFVWKKNYFLFRKKYWISLFLIWANAFIIKKIVLNCMKTASTVGSVFLFFQWSCCTW